MRCKKCGEKLPTGSKFCTKCGAPVQKKSAGKVFLIAAIVVLAVVCVGATKALLPKRGKKIAASSTSSDTNSWNQYPLMISWKDSGLEDHPMDFETDEAKNAVYTAMEYTYGEDKVDRNKEIMLSDCYELRRIYMSSKSSQADFEKICELVNLQELDFQYTDLTDISSIRNLKYLKILNLTSCGISDISPLAELTDLAHLNLSRNQVEDYSPLLALDKLNNLRLDFMDTPVDTDVLSQMTDIKYLSLDRAGLEDLEFLRNYAGLTNLSVNENNISDISPLEDKNKMEVFDFDYNNVSDIAPLKNKEEMFAVCFSHNKVRDISPLEGYKLVKLDASYNDIADISIIKDMIKISTLDLSGNNLSDISDLGYFESPHQIYLSHNNISDIKPLLDYENLGELDLSFNAIEGDFTVFGKNLAHLAKLDIAGNNITSFDGIENLPKLSTLLFDYPDIDVDPLLAGDKPSWIEFSEDTPDDVREKIKDSGKSAGFYAPDRDSYEITLDDVGPNKVKVIKEVREITGLGLAESKDLVEKAPTYLIKVYDYEEALEIISVLEENEAKVSLEIYNDVR